MKAGRLDRHIRIDEPANGVDGMNAPALGWSPVWTCDAEISFGSSREFFANAREGGAAGVRINLRMPPPSVNVTVACRVTDLETGVIYAIEQVGFDNERTMLKLACVAGENDG